MVREKAVMASVRRTVPLWDDSDNGNLAYKSVVDVGVKLGQIADLRSIWRLVVVFDMADAIGMYYCSGSKESFSAPSHRRPYCNTQMDGCAKKIQEIYCSRY